MSRRKFLSRGASSLLLAAVAPALWAQQPKYPSKPIKFVVPFAAGGGGDVVARMLALRLTERTGQPVLVENRTGAGGNIGSDYVLKSAPDGYTLLNMSSSYPIQAAVSKLPYDPIGDLQPIMMVSRDPVLLAVPTSSPVKTLKDLIDISKATPGKLTYGSAGVGSIAHLGMEEAAFMMGVQLTHVPYKGSSQAFNDLMGNNVDMMLTSATFGAPYVQSGRIRAIAIAGTKRTAKLPDVPTFAEQGYPDYQVVDWKAVAGPKGMPADVVAYLNRELNAVLKDKMVADKFDAEGSSPVGGSPEQMMAIIRSDIQRWKDVAQKAQVKIE